MCVTVCAVRSYQPLTVIFSFSLSSPRRRSISDPRPETVGGPPGQVRELVHDQRATKVHSKEASARGCSTRKPDAVGPEGAGGDLGCTQELDTRVKVRRQRLREHVTRASEAILWMLYVRASLSTRIDIRQSFTGSRRPAAVQWRERQGLPPPPNPRHHPQK